MNVEVENLPNCQTTLRVELPPAQVEKTWDEIAKDYSRYARIPGFRAGKAPRVMVEKKFQKEIREEVKKRLLSESYREAIAEKKLRVLSVSDVEDFEIAEDKTLRFTATLVTAPEFELPEYKGIPVTARNTDVTEEEVTAFIEALRDRLASFEDLTDTPLEMGLFAVVDYEGSIDGKPLEEAAPKAIGQLARGKNFWLMLDPKSFLPGFSEHLVGAIMAEERAFQIELPGDFPVDDLKGRKIDYVVTTRGIKRKILPALDDAFLAQVDPGKTMEEFRVNVRGRIEVDKRLDAERDRRNQIMNVLLGKIECELPPAMVGAETRRIVSELVKENQSRGIPDEAIRESQKELLSAAADRARERLKSGFVLTRIAEQEKITVSTDEFEDRLVAMARQYGMTPEKLRKELDERGSLGQVEEDILTGKVLDFLSSNASVQTGS